MHRTELRTKAKERRQRNHDKTHEYDLPSRSAREAASLFKKALHWGPAPPQVEKNEWTKRAMIDGGDTRLVFLGFQTLMMVKQIIRVPGQVGGRLRVKHPHIEVGILCPCPETGCTKVSSGRLRRIYTTESKLFAGER